MKRPRLLDDEEFELILQRLTLGMSVHAACDSVCYLHDLQKTIAQNHDYAKRFHDTMRFRATQFISEIVDVADTEIDPYRAKVRIDARKFYAERLDPERYGNRFDMKVTHEVSIQAALAEAKQRVEISLNDTQYKDVTQRVDIIKQIVDKNSDEISDESDDLDYIFS